MAYGNYRGNEAGEAVEVRAGDTEPESERVRSV